jgi:predicted GNAT superfamily acetyltransferase
LTDFGEMKRAVEFQRLIWGASFSELVPAVVMWFASRTGGVIIGAFDGDEMVGLLFGMTGWDGTRPLHWSDMLAVLPSHRGRGVGLALKRFQRERLLENGVTRVNWTFDPLEARNAHLNFARLGVTSHEYIRDCYGISDSPLHQGIGTDRLVVTWDLDSPRVRGRMEGGDSPPGYDGGEVVNV